MAAASQRPWFRFRLRNALLAMVWVAVWGVAFRVDQSLSAIKHVTEPPIDSILLLAMRPALGILPFTAIGTLFGDTLAGAVVGGIAFSIGVVVVQSLS
jgi:hypothetical protein